MLHDVLIFSIFTLPFLILCVYFNKLSLAGACSAYLLATIIYLGTGVPGLILIGVFFLIATWATSHCIENKIKSNLATARHVRRNAFQVWANGGIAGLTGLLCVLFPDLEKLFTLMMAGSISAALADTLSSELGVVYGKRFYHILTFKEGRRGVDGMVSLEGSLAGLSGSCLISIIYSIIYSLDIDFLAIIIGGTIGNLVDSILGDSLEIRGILNNNTVNFLNTCTGSLIAGIFYFI